MHWEWHVAAAGVMIAAERNFAAAIVMGQVGIDVIDHGLWAVINVRPLSIKNIKKTMDGLFERLEGQCYFFHTVEVWILMMLWLSRWQWGRWFLAAYTIHLLMDAYWYLRITKKWDWIKKWSLGWWLWRIYRKEKT